MQTSVFVSAALNQCNEKPSFVMLVTGRVLLEGNFLLIPLQEIEFNYSCDDDGALMSRTWKERKERIKDRMCLI